MHTPIPQSSNTPTERLTHVDLIATAKERGEFRRYLEEHHAETARLKNWRAAAWLETLRELV